MHPLLVEGLSDAIGFLAGVFLAYWLGRAVGFDPLAPGDGGYWGGILMAGLGGGVGLHAARFWRRSRRKDE